MTDDTKATEPSAAEKALADMRDALERVRTGRCGPRYDAGVRDGRAEQAQRVAELEAENKAMRRDETRNERDDLRLRVREHEAVTRRLEAENARLRANSMAGAAEAIREKAKTYRTWTPENGNPWTMVADWLSQQAASQAPQGGEDAITSDVDLDCMATMLDGVNQLREQLATANRRVAELEAELEAAEDKGSEWAAEQLLTIAQHGETLGNYEGARMNSAIEYVVALKQLVEEVRATFRKHNLAAGPTAIDRLVEQRDSLTRELAEAKAAIETGYRHEANLRAAWHNAKDKLAEARATTASQLKDLTELRATYQDLFDTHNRVAKELIEEPAEARREHLSQFRAAQDGMNSHLAELQDSLASVTHEMELLRDIELRARAVWSPEHKLLKALDAHRSAKTSATKGGDAMQPMPSVIESAGGRVGTDSPLDVELVRDGRDGQLKFVPKGAVLPELPPYETAPRLTKGAGDEHDWLRGLDGAYHSTEARCVLCGLEANGPLPVRGCPGRVVRVEPEKADDGHCTCFADEDDPRCPVHDHLKQQPGRAGQPEKREGK